MLLKFSDNYDFAVTKDEVGMEVRRCMVRHAKLTITQAKMIHQILFLMFLMVLQCLLKKVKKLKLKLLLFQWDPYTDIILARETGIVKLKDFVEGETFSVESVETGKKQIVVIEARDRKLSPHLEIVDKKGEIVAGSTILPVKATLVVNDKEEGE